MKIPLAIDVTAEAEFSPCGKYRYVLKRTWKKDLGYVLWIMLNPSSASAEEDDPTVAKCQTYARLWGYGGIIVVNIFAWRSTNPDLLSKVLDPVGPFNDAVIAAAALEVDAGRGLVVCAWGNHGDLLGRGRTVREMLRDSHVKCHALKVNRGGHPQHPLYVSLKIDPKEYTWQ